MRLRRSCKAFNDVCKKVGIFVMVLPHSFHINIQWLSIKLFEKKHVCIACTTMRLKLTRFMPCYTIKKLFRIQNAYSPSHITLRILHFVCYRIKVLAKILLHCSPCFTSSKYFFIS